MTADPAPRTPDQATLVKIKPRQWWFFLDLDQPRTAAELATRSGLVVTSVKSHLRALTNLGLIETAPDTLDRYQQSVTLTEDQEQYARKRVRSTQLRRPDERTGVDLPLVDPDTSPDTPVWVRLAWCGYAVAATAALIALFVTGHPFLFTFGIPLAVLMPVFLFDEAGKAVLSPSVIGGGALMAAIAGALLMAVFSIFGMYPDDAADSPNEDISTPGENAPPGEDCGRLGSWVANQGFTGEEREDWLGIVQQCYDNR